MKKTHKTLSKSDYKLACSCPKKLYYKKQKYPSNLEQNEFMKMLAEGGYVVGKLAQLLHPGEEIVDKEMEIALERTADLLKRDQVTIHEAAIRSGQKIVRIDILKKNGNHFDLIEVKAKSFDSTNEDDFKRAKKEAKLSNKTKDYVKDAIFQTIVLQESYPQSSIDTYLLMPDKSSVMTIEGLPSWFKTKITEPTEPGGFRKIDVTFNDTEVEKTNELISVVKESNLLGLLKLNEEVKDFKEDVIRETNKFLELLNSDFKGYHPVLNKDCKKCEYHATENDRRDGFKDCWKEMADVDSKIWDLYQAGKLKMDEEYFVNLKINERKVSFDELSEVEFGKGAYDIRREIQYENTINNSEYPSSEIDLKVFASNLNEKFVYPLHFIDFETMASAIPFHKGLSPYNMFPFQWSLHTIEKPGAAPTHHEYLNTEPGYPGFRFAEHLMAKIGTEGTTLMWSTHENTTLKNVLKHMDMLEYYNPELKSWLINITKEKNGNKVLREGRFVDMNDFALKNYFHPDMRGRTSIKVTLPAIWTNNNYLHNIPWFKEWVIEEDGKIADPYQKLKLDKLADFWGFVPATTSEAEEEIAEFGDGSYDVKDGGAAMKAYQDLIYSSDQARKDQLAKQLLKYCELDTLAMVIIYTHWQNLANGIG